MHWLKTGEEIDKTELTSIAKEQKALEDYENE